jgi:hypothetical protein
MVSAAYGFALGREALKGVTQPDVRPVNNMAARKGGLPRREEVTLLKEDDIIANVKAQTDSSGSAPANRGNRSKSLESNSSASDSKAIAAKNLPITSFDRGVTLEVRSVRQQGGAVVLGVSLRNDSERQVRFLYSFLNVTDDQGRVISASTDGLPADLPPRSETVSGTISISTALLENAKQLSLSLTDYPDQQLQLQAAGIPVAR